MLAASANTFEIVGREWLKKTAGERMASTQGKVTTWLEKDVFPYIGKMPISTIGPRDVLAALRHMEGRGALDSVQRVKQICGQVFRYAVASGSAERDETQDLKGALAKPVSGHFAAITDPKKAGDLLRSIFSYQGHPYTVAALKLSPMVFVRPGDRAPTGLCCERPEWPGIQPHGALARTPGNDAALGGLPGRTAGGGGSDRAHLTLLAMKTPWPDGTCAQQFVRHQV
jgi:hypothetical protein